MKIPMRLKIMLGLTLLLLGTISLNLYFSSQVISQDKEKLSTDASLYELNKLATLFRESTNQIVRSSTLYSQIAHNNKKLIESIFKNNGAIKFFSFKPPGQGWQIPKENQHIAINEWFSDANSSLPTDKPLHLQGLTLSNKNYLFISNQTTHGDVAFVLDFTKLKNSFSVNNISSNHIFNNDGSPFFQGKKEKPSFLTQIIKSTSQSGTQKITENNIEYRVSYLRIPKFNILAFTNPQKNDPFQYLDHYIDYGLYTILIMFAVILGLSFFLNAQVLKPIKDLDAAIQSYNSGDLNEEIGIEPKDEFKELGASINLMTQQTRNLIQDKKKVIDDLEVANQSFVQALENKTKELQKSHHFVEAIMNSIKQGLLVFDKDLNIEDTFTKSCHEIFNMDIKGKTYAHILGLDDQQTGVLKKGVDLIFSEKIPFKSSSKLINQSKVIGETFEETDFKHISLEYFPMRDKDTDNLTHIVVVATDKTEEIKAIESFKTNEAYTDMISKLIGNKTQFMSFIRDVRKSLKAIGDEIEKEQPNLDNILMQYHTINGGAGTYSVIELQDIARINEQHVIDQQEQGKLQIEKLFDDFGKCISIYRDLENEINKVLGKNTNSIEIDKDIIDELNKKIQVQVNQKTYSYFRDHFYNEPVESYVSEYRELIRTVARKTGKRIKPLEIIGGDVRIPPNVIDSFFSSLVHLFRNCVDHGIEKPDKRKRNNKDVHGKIVMTFNKDTKDNKEYLDITVTDDGAGINPEVIRKKWIEKNPEDQTIGSLNDSEVIYKIFDPSFSTADELSEYSGRGVGMSAIKEIVAELGGFLELKSEVGQGSTFHFSLPLP